MDWTVEEQAGPSMEQSSDQQATQSASVDLAPSLYMQQLDRALSLDGLFHQLDSINSAFSDVAPISLSKPQKRTAKSRLYNMGKIKNNRKWLRELFLDHSDDSTDWSEYDDEEFGDELGDKKPGSKPKKTPAEKAAADDKEIREMLRMHRFMKKLSKSSHKRDKQVKSPIDYASLDGMSVNYLSLPITSTSVSKRAQMKLPKAGSQEDKPPPKRKRNRDNKKKTTIPAESKDAPNVSVSEPASVQESLRDTDSPVSSVSLPLLDSGAGVKPPPIQNIKTEPGLFDEITYDTTLPDEFLEGLGLATNDSDLTDVQSSSKMVPFMGDPQPMILRQSDIEQVLGKSGPSGICHIQSHPPPQPQHLIPSANAPSLQQHLQQPQQQGPIVTQSQITNIIDVTNNPSALPSQLSSLNLPPGLVMSQTSMPGSSGIQTTVSFPIINQKGQAVTVNMIQNLQQHQQQQQQQQKPEQPHQVEIKKVMKKKKKPKPPAVPDTHTCQVPEKPKVKIPSLAERRKNIWLLIGKIEIPKAITRRNMFIARRNEHTRRLAEWCREACKSSHDKPVTETGHITVTVTNSGKTICPTWSSLSSRMAVEPPSQPMPKPSTSSSLEVTPAALSKPAPRLNPPSTLSASIQMAQHAPSPQPPPPPPPPPIIQLPIVLTQVTTIPEIDLPAIGPDSVKSITLTPTMETCDPVPTSSRSLASEVEIIPLGMKPK